jgi:transposase-like protein
MAQQLSHFTKAAYVRAITAGVSVQELSIQTGISRTSLYNWVKTMKKEAERTHKKANRHARERTYGKQLTKAKIREVKRLAVIHADYPLETIAKRTNMSKSAVWKLLKEFDLTTKEKRSVYKQSYYRHIARSVDEDIYNSIQKAKKSGLSVVEVCRTFGISRTTYYAMRKSGKKHLKPRNRPAGEMHYRYIAAGQEVILGIITENPEQSIRSIVDELKMRTGAGSVFYVYAILKENNLTTKNQRSAYLVGRSMHVTKDGEVLSLNLLGDFFKGLLFPVALASAVIIVIAPFSLRNHNNLPDQSGISINKTPTIELAAVETVTKPDLSWGVIGINVPKSVYKPGEDARLAVSVLDERGMGSCYAELTANIIDPTGHTETYSTHSRNIQHSPTCGAATITDKPDYWLDYPVKKTGKYTVTLIAKTKKGKQTATTSFISASSAPVSIERVSAGRVWPWSLYTMKVKVKAEKDFTGDIVEQVPGDFVVYTDDGQMKDTPQSKTVRWSTHIPAGQTKEFSYDFDTPDVSPELYRLGQLEVLDTNHHVVMRESHAWQLAVDGMQN